jgi:hypothetical protein
VRLHAETLHDIAEGDVVERGGSIAAKCREVMAMQHEITAPRNGTNPAVIRPS